MTQGMDCIVYLDEITRNPDGSFNAYLDFRTKNDVALFKQAFQNNAEFDEQRSYLYIKSVKSCKRLIHDCYYKLNLDLLKNAQVIGSDKLDSFVVGIAFDLGKMPQPVPKDESSELLQSHDPMDPSEMQIGDANESIDLPQFNGKDLRIAVRNVGQGNWNELLDGDKVLVVYDIGANRNARRDVIDALFKTREDDLMRYKPILVLSHWDIDHYICLKGLTSSQISLCFSKCICVNKIMSISATLTYLKVKASLGDVIIL